MSGNGHPAWQEILSEIPEEYHHFVKPKLQAWDQGVQQKIQEVHDQYKDYADFKGLVDNNIDPDYVEQAIALADQLQANPKKVMEQVNQAWNLGFVESSSVQPDTSAGESTDDDPFDGEDDGMDITKHPKFSEIESKLNELQTQYEAKQTAEQEEADAQAFEQYLNELETSVTEKNLPFDRTFVTALIAQGLDGQDAVKQFHTIIASAGVQLPDGTEGDQQQPESDSGDDPPVVMGGDGTTGSGLPDQSVKFGTLSKNDLNSTVEQLLDQALNSGQG
jgi:hypothetical protein